MVASILAKAHINSKNTLSYLRISKLKPACMSPVFILSFRRYFLNADLPELYYCHLVTLVMVPWQLSKVIFPWLPVFFFLHFQCRITLQIGYGYFRYVKQQWRFHHNLGWVSAYLRFGR